MSTPVVTTEDMACLADVARELRHSETGAALRHLARHRQQVEASFKAREDALVQALQDVVNPLANLQRYAEARGNNLGPQAYSIANNLAFVQGIARDALLARAHTATDAVEGGE